MKKISQQRWNMSNKGHWRKILLEIYNSAPNKWGYSSKIGYSENSHPLAKKFKISGHELMLNICFLEDNKLIKTNPSGEGIDFSAVWNLTEKGFNVALDLEKHASDQKIQKLLASGGSIIAVLSIINFLNLKEFIFRDISKLNFFQGLIQSLIIISLFIPTAYLLKIGWEIFNKD